MDYKIILILPKYTVLYENAIYEICFISIIALVVVIIIIIIIQSDAGLPGKVFSYLKVT